MVTSPSWPSGPGELIAGLAAWARDTSWVEWLELSGSLARGAGDERSDVDAALGVSGGVGTRLHDVEQEVTSLAPAAAMLHQGFGSGSTHLLTVYADGRQLSLVVMPSDARPGLPPQGIALVDKADRLAGPLDPSRWDADGARRREWTFLACIAAADAVKHADRGTAWRAVQCVQEARDLYLRLLAAREAVTFPEFGAVSLEVAGRTVPRRLGDTLVGDLDRDAIHRAVEVLSELTQPFIAEHALEPLALALGLPVGGDRRSEHVAEVHPPGDGLTRGR